MHTVQTLKFKEVHLQQSQDCVTKKINSHKTFNFYFVLGLLDPSKTRMCHNFCRFLNHIFGSTRGISVTSIRCVKDQATGQLLYFLNHPFQKAKGQCSP